MFYVIKFHCREIFRNLLPNFYDEPLQNGKKNIIRELSANDNFVFERAIRIFAFHFHKTEICLLSTAF